MSALSGSDRGTAVPSRWGLVLPVLVVAAVLVIVVPIPAGLLDVLLTANIALAVLILLTVLHIRRTLELSAFPSILLLATLFRLVLNIASTRLILSGAGERGLEAAGGIIAGFGQFVTAGSPVVGLVLFAIVVLVQFIVVTAGANRISEVAARFTLDGLPGRQMMIDGDLSAGRISEQEAGRRIEQLHGEADFFAAMDGAGKFVRGDAIAAVAISIVNIAVGLGLGVFQQGLPWAEAASLFTTLTIGDGLVSQLPSFLLAVATGLMVTRGSQTEHLSHTVAAQLAGQRTALVTAGALLAALSLTSLPTVPFLVLGAICVATAYAGDNKRSASGEADPVERESVEHESVKQSSEPASQSQPSLQTSLQVAPIQIELGVSLLQLAGQSNGEKSPGLPQLIQQLRMRLIDEIGFVLPRVRTQDNLRLGATEFQIRIRDRVVLRGSLENIEPAAAKIIIWRLEEAVRVRPDALLTRQHVHELLVDLRQHAPQLVDELVPDVLRPPLIHQVLGRLLNESVSIRDMERILQTLGDYADRSDHPILLTERVRRALGDSICQRYQDSTGVLRAVLLAPEVEDLLETHLSYTDELVTIRLPHDIQERLFSEIERSLQRLSEQECPPVIVCRPSVRAGLAELLSSLRSHAVVLSSDEVTSHVSLTPVQTVPSLSAPTPATAA